MDLLIFGPPGAGKGTQAATLSKSLGMVQIATGDLMRKAVKSGSDLGKRFEHYMSQGLYVPDDMTIELLANRLDEGDAQNGAIFDGFPRTVAQAEALEGLLGKISRKINGILNLEVDLDSIVDRISGRRVCESCGQTYHVRYNPPPKPIDGEGSVRCVSCGKINSIIQRKDDNQDVVKSRNEIYLNQTLPILDFYKKKYGACIVHSLNGVGTQEEVYDRLRLAIETIRSGHKAP